MSADSIALYAGVVLSLLFSYVPGLNSWFGALDGIVKRLVMLGLLVLVAVISYGLACLGWAADVGLAGVACTKVGFAELVKALITAVIANQGAYAISPQKK